jgi:hypothetical protein
MPATCLSLVNQKLAYARELLALVPDRAASENPKGRLLCRALVDAAIAHLVCAYQHYLRELGENYRIKQLASIKCEQDLIATLGELGRTSSEVDELLQLRADETSWLAKLFRSYESQSALPLPTAQIATPKAENLISLVEVNDASTELEVTPERVTLWQQDFVGLIQRQRETSAEY